MVMPGYFGFSISISWYCPLVKNKLDIVLFVFWRGGVAYFIEGIFVLLLVLWLQPNSKSQTHKSSCNQVP